MSEAEMAAMAEAFPHLGRCWPRSRTKAPTRPSAGATTRPSSSSASTSCSTASSTAAPPAGRPPDRTRPRQARSRRTTTPRSNSRVSPTARYSSSRVLDVRRHGVDLLGGPELQQAGAHRGQHPRRDLHTAVCDVEAVGSAVDGHERVLRVLAHVVRQHPGRVGDHEGEAFVGQHDVLHLTAPYVDPVGEPGRLGIEPGEVAGHRIHVDLDEPPVTLTHRHQPDVPSARAQLEHGPHGQGCQQLGCPRRLLSGPRPRFEHPFVVGDREPADLDAAPIVSGRLTQLRLRHDPATTSMPGDLVRPVAPRRRRGVAAPAHRRHRPGGAVLATVLVLDHVVATEQGRASRAEHDVRRGLDVLHAVAPQASSRCLATRSSWSRQVNTPRKTSSCRCGSASTIGTQIARTASCSWTASASTCSS